MILAVWARYFGPADCVQVSIVLQEDDYSSAAAKLREGTVKIMQGNDPMYTETFNALDRLYDFDGDTNYDNVTDTGKFIFLFYHPPIQHNMAVQVDVTLADDRTSTKRVNIEVEDDEEKWHNPFFEGRTPVEVERDPTGVPYRKL